uniref:BetaGRP n=1 Tax=Anatolica polita borealis TaxID=442711 RepID=A0A1L5YEV2_9CUCU|nr:betaGRP [Anatolica polita borealis]
MFCKVVLLILFGSCIASATHNYKPLKYSVPEPLIQAFRPRGLKVSIPHTTGIQLFAFHGNINKPLHGNRPGQLNAEIRVKDGDHCVFQDPTVKLEIGDKIYYRLFVIKDNLGYRYDGGIYEVTDTTDAGSNNESRTIDVAEKTERPNPENFDLDSRMCEKRLLNLTQTLLNLQYEIDSLKDTNIILRDLVGEHPATTLTLHGPLPEDGMLNLLVQDVLRHKLGLRLGIRNVVRTGDGVVKFETATLDDKITVLKAAKQQLKYSKYSIVSI